MSARQDAIEITNTICNEHMCATDKKLALFNEIRELLASGTKKDDILAKIYNYKERHPRAHIDSIYTVLQEPYNVNEEENLIEPNRFYYHNRLQVTPGLPVIEIKEDGTIESHYPKFFLEIVNSFTIKDLADYIAQKDIVQDPISEQNIGGLRYLLKKYASTVKEPYNILDLILYTVDAAYMLMHELDLPKLSSILKLSEFINEGWQIYYNAYNAKKAAGLDHIIPKGDEGKC